MSEAALHRYFLAHRANRLPSARRLAQHVRQMRQLNTDMQVRGLWIVHQHSSLLILESDAPLDKAYYDGLEAQTNLDAALHVHTSQPPSGALMHPLACLELSNYRMDTTISHIHAIAQQDKRRAQNIIQQFLKTCLQINLGRAAA